MTKPYPCTYLCTSCITYVAQFCLATGCLTRPLTIMMFCYSISVEYLSLLIKAYLFLYASAPSQLFSEKFPNPLLNLIFVFSLRFDPTLSLLLQFFVSCTEFCVFLYLTH